jgi:transglutaminase-like putative cysteine protease
MSFLPISRPVFLILYCFLSLRGLCQSPVRPIADSLKKEAVMVVRKNEMEIEIISPRKAKMVHRYVLTILNSRGDIYAHVHTFYDKFHDVVSATGILYDGEGRQLKKIRKGDMQDWNTDGSGILMSDIRLKYYPFVCRSYPYTVSYEEETEMDGLFNLPEWQPQAARDIAVENSSLVIKTPAGYPLRYRAYHYPGEALVSEVKGEKIYTWQMKDLPALAEEPYEPAWFHLAASVRLVPAEFELQGYKGSLYSWVDIGKFVGSLYQGRDQLPDEAKKKVHELVDGLTGDRQKIDVLYRFLQHNTHYVGIELGIGGWQPFDASYVYYKRYGDCKALSNYMVALLKEAGIRASNVLIRGGNVPALDTGFACPQFNHAIAVAFTGKDSVWLECTSSLLAPGYLGSFTADRDALLIDPAGSHIIHTPVYGVRENHLDRRVQGNISSDGRLDASLTCNYTGLEQDALQWRIDQLTKKDLLQERREALGIQNVTVKDLSWSFDSSGIPAIRETMSLAAGQYATISGDRLLISPGYFLRRGAGLKEETHSRPFELSPAYEETDSISLVIPAGYQPEGSPFNASFTCPCGNYRIRSLFSDGVYTITCHFQQNKGLYDAAAWPRLVRLFNLVHREGDRVVVFVRH